MSNKTKVFCIGFQKTGTSSLAKALEMMGFHVGRRLSIFRKQDPDFSVVAQLTSETYQPFFVVANKYDALVDNPWPFIYKELAEHYPNSKFILTTRDENDWLDSVKRYFGETTTEIRQFIYGVDKVHGNEARFLSRYRKHNQEVIAYFDRQPERLLVLPLASNQKWELLEHFLNRLTPELPYPAQNRTDKVKSTSKLAKASALGWKTRQLYLHIVYQLALARIAITAAPFRKVAKRMSSPLPKNAPFDKTALTKAVYIGQVIRSVSKRLPFRAQCFEQALAAQAILASNNLPSTIYFGVIQPKAGQPEIKAHAWLDYEDITITGADTKEEFTVVSRFSNRP